MRLRLLEDDNDSEEADFIRRCELGLGFETDSIPSEAAAVFRL